MCFMTIGWDETGLAEATVAAVGGEASLKVRRCAEASSQLYDLRAILIEIDEEDGTLRIGRLICEVHESGYTVL